MKKRSTLVTGTLFSLFALTLFSCKKSDDASPEVEPPVVTETRPLLDSVITISSNPEWNEATAYRYNADSTQAADIYISTGQLNGVFLLYKNKQLTRYVYSPTGNINDSTDVYMCSYDSKGRLAIINPDNWGNRDSLVYNDANQLVRRYKFYSNELEYADTLTWTGKNLTTYRSVQRIYGGTENDVYIQTWTFKYDEQKNPYQGVPSSSFFYQEDRWKLSENNAVEVAYQVTNGVSHNIRYAYTYNDKHYPASAAYVKTGEGVSDDGTVRFVYRK